MEVITLTDLFLLFFLFCVTRDDICKIILKIKIKFILNDKEIPEVWNTVKFRNVVCKNIHPTECILGWEHNRLNHDTPTHRPLNHIIWYIYIFNLSWVDTRWQQYITNLHTNSTHNTEKGKLGSAHRAPSYDKPRYRSVFSCNSDGSRSSLKMADYCRSM
jgi:hypothetical protein